ncbi:MAG: serine/threonine-protein kinase [Pseudomonadota bacterium]
MTRLSREIEVEALSLFEAALDLPSTHRRTWLINKTNRNAQLRQRALALLDADLCPSAPFQTGGALRSLLPPKVPERIGDYRIARLIGRGGMGAVYLGERDVGDFDHQVAIKVVENPERSQKLAKRLREERQTLAKLAHPNIAHLHDGDETEDGHPYLIMEFVDGAPLGVYIETEAPPLAVRLKLMLEMCEAVAFAHRNLIIHRDLSPANALVHRDGHVKLIDFGIAHAIGAETDKPRRTMTRGYTAPERVAGQAATTQSDIFSLGVILGEIVDGIEVPRRADLEAIVAMATAEDPENRYATVRNLALDLEAYEAGRPVSARADEGWRYHAIRFVARRRMIVFAGLAVMVLLIVSSISTSIFLLQNQRMKTERDLLQVLSWYEENTANIPDSVSNLRGLISQHALLAHHYARANVPEKQCEHALQGELYTLRMKALVEFEAPDQAFWNEVRAKHLRCFAEPRP